MRKQSKSFINTDFLEEEPKVDSTTYETEAKKFTKKINKFNKSTLIALVGNYGIGKSTLIGKAREKSWDTWFQFDAWRYPERRELREGFLIKLYTDLWGKKDDILRKIEWGDKERIKRVKWILLGLAFLLWLSDIYYRIVCWYDGFWGTILWAWFLLFANVLEKLTDNVPKNLSLTRVFQFEDEVKNMLKKHSQTYKRIYIVLEDVDRSWSEGLFFLETLSYFLKIKKIEEADPKIESGPVIIPIVLVSENNWYNDIDSYLKFIDHYELFSKAILQNGIQEFINWVFSMPDTSVNKPVFRRIMNQEISRFLNNPSGNYRLLKFMLRKMAIEIELRLIDHKNIIPELFLCLNFWIFVAQINKNIGNSKERKDGRVFTNHEERTSFTLHQQKDLLQLIPNVEWVNDNDFTFQYNYNTDTIVFERNNVYLPWYYRL